MNMKSTHDSEQEHEPLLNDDLAKKIDDLLVDRFMDAYAEKAGQAFLEFTNSLPDTEESQLTPEKLESFQKRLRKARKAMQPKKPRIRRLRILIPAAVLIALLGITAGANRTKIFNFFGISTPAATEYVPKDVGNRPYEFNYIPYNFTERQYEFENNVLHAYLCQSDNIENFINVYVYFNQPGVKVDNEGLDSKDTVLINDAEADYTEKNGVVKIVWSAPNLNAPSPEDSPIRFHVATTLPKDEAIKFSENILRSSALK